MAKRQPARSSKPQGRRAHRDDDAPPPPRKPKAVWPFVLLMLLAWWAIFGAVFWSHFLSDLPDVKNLFAQGPSRDVTILDDHGRMTARRGLVQGGMVQVNSLPSYVPNAFTPIEDRRF